MEIDFENHWKLRGDQINCIKLKQGDNQILLGADPENIKNFTSVLESCAEPQLKFIELIKPDRIEAFLFGVLLGYVIFPLLVALGF